MAFIKNCEFLYLDALRTNSGQCWGDAAENRLITYSTNVNCCTNNKTQIFERSNRVEKLFDSSGNSRYLNDAGNYFINSGSSKFCETIKK